MTECSGLDALDDPNGDALFTHQTLLGDRQDPFYEILAGSIMKKLGLDIPLLVGVSLIRKVCDMSMQYSVDEDRVLHDGILACLDGI